MAPPVKSNVWSFFIKGDGSAKCKLCCETVKTKGNTTNLKVHLKRHHNDVLVREESSSQLPIIQKVSTHQLTQTNSCVL